MIDCYSVKPIDAETLGGLQMSVVTIEDHWAEGRLGEAVLSALAEAETEVRVTRLAVRELPHSGKPDELLAALTSDVPAVLHVP